ncbi:MAG: PepSY-associated TM helix domain-containing protein [Thermonemataceae bacterium]|nr:PepSY-associated TM helix domain-containing protein [Thermonemataceae bacterium]
MPTIKRIRKLNASLHRDLGYFFSALILIYCISGIALNHINDWNPDFILQHDTIRVGEKLSKKTLREQHIQQYNTLVKEEKHKLYDFPTDDQVKIYYDNASLHINFSKGIGVYEKVAKRAIFYQFNVLHRNNLKAWKWVADIFGVMLIAITLTGIFIMRGRYGIKGRGKWFILGGLLIPLIAIFIHLNS